ncbi:NAD(P)H-dependent FMN reductase [Nocardioides thalensis]|uniref:NAD(P)H-dependent FMN reductase n=1 Tax=Nocardioides thalensis TaxID=1914755 RepID=A0A853BYK7_9ACTN|nr:NAD(P)H-dependent oxidoreductase [Nocardioides thalensis]NYI99926.1 NAD(P)H-dependent FMN reductase [Nocardioides thalensis]
MTTTKPLTIAVILGSTRPGRLGPAVADWITPHLEQHGDLVVDLIDPAASADPAEHGSRLDRADGYVVVTPEYNHSFPAPLKELIDAHGAVWHAKPVTFVSYGAFSGGLRAIEHLRGVFAELHAATLRDTVSLPMIWEHLDGEGRLAPPASAEAAAKILVDRLAWWAAALAEARTRSPYAA